MLKIEAESLELAYSQAAEKLSCSITQLNVEVVQAPSSGFLGLFKKPAIIVAVCKVEKEISPQNKQMRSAQADVSSENKQMRSAQADVSSENKQMRSAQADVSSENKTSRSQSDVSLENNRSSSQNKVSSENDAKYISSDKVFSEPLNKVSKNKTSKPQSDATYENKTNRSQGKTYPQQRSVVPLIKEESKVAREPVATKEKATQVKTIQPVRKKEAPKKEYPSHRDIILPASFVTDQEEDDYDGSDLYEDEEYIYVGEETEICDKSHDEIHQQLAGSFKHPSTQANDNFFSNSESEKTCKPSEVALEIKEKISALFKHACFEIDEIKVCEHDDKTVLVEFTGKDAALLIGKEGYRYKALSYMLYNWINATYQLQLRLEIAEFLKNQEEMIAKYLEGVYVNIDRDGRAQTKILDGVLVQIALRELRKSYPDKYVAIRSTRDGAKFIIINSFNNN